MHPPARHRPYRPAPWLVNPHLQTIWGRLARRLPALPLRRERWITPDDDFLDIQRMDASSPDAPTFLLLHGLESSLRSHYILPILKLAAARGWESNLLYFRGCSGEPNRQARSYHSGETTDVAMVVERLKNERPDAPLIVAGVSLGGNVLLKYLGEQGEALEGVITAATAISVPFDLARSCQHLDTHASFYTNWFLKTLRPKALAKVAQFPGLADPEAIRRSNSMWSFDDAYTSVVHGFADAADYYRQSSAINFLGGVRVPTLLLSSHDDPFHPPDLLYDVEGIARRNSALVTEFVDVGGHVGFVEGAVPWRTSSYCERRAIEFGVSQLNNDLSMVLETR
ncbi:MAG: alpha/beta fold hydrolase [Gemmatimonadetes bacterium]|nr:alpha/beta fold hydrolase [Gemmatimonadota bacterium]